MPHGHPSPPRTPGRMVLRRPGIVGAMGAGSGILAKVAYDAGKGMVKNFLKRKSKEGKKRKLESKKSSPSRAIHDSTANSGTQAVTTIVTGKRASFKATDGRWKFSDQMTGKFEGQEGQQYVMVLGNFMCPSQFLTNTAGVPSRLFSKTTSVQGFFGINPYQKSTGGTATNNTSIAFADDKLVLERITAKYMFCNGTTIPLFFTLYVVKYLQSSSSDAPTVWNQALVDQKMGTSSGAIQTNPSAAVTAVGGYANNTYLGKCPTDNAGFRRQFKVLAVKKMILASGDNVEWKLTLIDNKLYDQEKLVVALAAGAYMRGTIQVFGVIHGGMVVDQTAADLTSTTGTPELLAIASAEYDMKTPKDKVERTQVTYAVPSLSFGTALAQQYAPNVINTYNTGTNRINQSDADMG